MIAWRNPSLNLSVSNLSPRWHTVISLWLPALFTSILISAYDVQKHVTACQLIFIGFNLFCRHYTSIVAYTHSDIQLHKYFWYTTVDCLFFSLVFYRSFNVCRFVCTNDIIGDVLTVYSIFWLQMKKAATTHPGNKSTYPSCIAFNTKAAFQ